MKVKALRQHTLIAQPFSLALFKPTGLNNWAINPCTAVKNLSHHDVGMHLCAGENHPKALLIQHNQMTMPSNNPEQPKIAFRLRRWQWMLLGSISALVVFFIVFDWNWLRKPLERYISEKTQREFSTSDLDVDLGLTPTVKLKDVYFANAQWSKTGQPMAKIGSLEFSLSLRDLWQGKVWVPRVTLTKANILFEKTSDERKNWTLAPTQEATEPSRFRISSLSVSDGKLRYIDHGEPLSVDVQTSTFLPGNAAMPTEAKAAPQNTAYTTRYSFKGKYHEAGFDGEALTGDVLSFQESNIPFPIKAKLNAGTTQASVEGTVADVLSITSVNVRLSIAGSTLANLYPFLLLPLPASPPYAFTGHLTQKGQRYGIDDLQGKIGSTDISGSATYERKLPRPLITAKLSSKLLNITDLGPLIGIETKGTKNLAASERKTAKLTQADTATRAKAQVNERQTAGNKILPTGTLAAKGDGILPSGRFEGGRLKVIDAEVDYVAGRLKAPNALPVENMKLSFHLRDAVAKITPLEFGFSGGRIVSDITIDARQDKLLSSIFNVDFRNIKVAKLFPTMPTLTKGVGELGAQIRLSGSGNSIADAAANANGSVTAAIANGRISNLLDAMAGLNGGKIISLYLGGDKDIAVNCGGIAFDVKNGVGQSQLFVIDTEQTRLDGSGSFNLKDEQLDITLTPVPKNPGILSLRTPVRLYGSFRNPSYSLDKGKMIMRAGAATALALINPFAALIPLIETGPGKDTDCAKLLAPVKGARQQAKSTGTAPPKGSSSRY